MIKIKHLFSIILTTALSLNLASCLDSGKHEMSQTLVDEILVVTNDNGELKTAQGTINLKVNLNTGKGDLLMPVQVGDEVKNAYFRDLTIKYDNAYGYTFSATSIEATDAEKKSLNFSINSLNGYIQMGDAVDATHSNIGVTYSVNSKQVYATKGSICYPYTRTTTSLNSSSSYNCENAVYTVTFDTEKKTANIEVNKIKFAEASPTLSEITIPNVPYTITSSGYHLQTDNVIPTSMGVPMESRAITDLDFTLQARDGSFYGQFYCMGMNCSVAGTLAKAKDE